MEESINAFNGEESEGIVLTLNGQKLSVIEIFPREQKSLNGRKKSR